MTARTRKTCCATCGKDKAIFKCEGCLQGFCYYHVPDHRQELNAQLDEIEGNRDQFWQTLLEQTAEPHKHALIQQINTWENDSIQKIRKTADEIRQILLRHAEEHFTPIKSKLNELTDQLRRSREEYDFIEADLQQWKQELIQLSNQFAQTPNITIEEYSTPLVTTIQVDISGHRSGKERNQLNHPHGVYVDDNRTIYVADHDNHRIVEWKCGGASGQIVAGGNGSGSSIYQLNHPTDVIVDKDKNSLIICDYDNRRVIRWPIRDGTNWGTIISNIDCSNLTMDKNGYLYISDYIKHEVRRWKIGETSGTLVAGGNGKGNNLNQLNGPTYVFVDKDNSVYVSDCYNDRVMKWAVGAKEGIVVVGNQKERNDLTQLHKPQKVIVDHLGTVYVVDCYNHRIMRWYKGATQGDVIVGENEAGTQANQLIYPIGLSFDRQGNLYVADSWNNRIQRFNIDRH